MKERSVKSIKICWFGFFDQMIILFFLWAKCSKSFRPIGYCFLLLLGVMIRKCLQMLSCTNLIQASSGLLITTRRQKKSYALVRFQHDLTGFFFLIRSEWTCSKQTSQKKKQMQRSIFSNTVYDRTSLTGEIFPATPQQSKVFLNNFLVQSMWVPLHSLWIQRHQALWHSQCQEKRLGWPDVLQKLLLTFWGKTVVSFTITLYSHFALCVSIGPKLWAFGGTLNKGI